MQACVYLWAGVMVGRRHWDTVLSVKNDRAEETVEHPAWPAVNVEYRCLRDLERKFLRLPYSHDRL